MPVFDEVVISTAAMNQVLGFDQARAIQPLEDASMTRSPAQQPTSMLPASSLLTQAPDSRVTCRTCIATSPIMSSAPPRLVMRRT